MDLFYLAAIDVWLISIYMLYRQVPHIRTLEGSSNKKELLVCSVSLNNMKK